MTHNLPQLPGFNGVKIILTPHLEQDGEPVEIKRTWRERLFTRPWQPFKATRTHIPKVPYKGAMKINEHTVAMHPQVYRELVRETNARG
jgi:hypothetical protein